MIPYVIAFASISFNTFSPTPWPLKSSRTIKLWGEGKSEFSAQDWHDFYQRSKSANYESWDHNGTDQELLFMAIREIDGKSEVVASIALCDFDDLEEFRRYKPWIAAFIVREDSETTAVLRT